jgi:hypothetical protein
MDKAKDGNGLKVPQDCRFAMSAIDHGLAIYGYQ